MKKICSIIFTCIYFNFLIAQSSFQFAQISDLHIGSHNAEEDLRRTVADINGNPNIKFVIASGDITEFGADAELLLAKQILDSLNKPWHIVPGNHDDNWSESGTNSFVKIFGAETFSFAYGGYHFIGTNCGPNMKMSPGQVPYENIVWMDSVLRATHPHTPIIFVNHYPLDSSLNNWYEVAALLKKYNTQLYMCGHGHRNSKFNFEGIPGVMGRSNLRAKDSVGGYNIVTIKDGNAVYTEKNPQISTKATWATVPLSRHNYVADTTKYPRPSYAVNHKYPFVKEIGRYQDSSDIGNGFVLYKNLVITPDSKGRILAIDADKKKVAWRFITNGKIYSSPAIENNKLIVPSTDGAVYCLQADNGKLLWSTATSKAIVAIPVIKGNKIFLGSSEGKFRALDFKTGKIVWEFDSVKNFVKTQPAYYAGKLIFGSWGNELYAVNALTGKADWIYNDGYTNRMFSPASCIPVIANNRVFIVAPDRYMTALDATTGKLIWKHRWDDSWVRESIGLSNDSSMVYAKTMQGHLIGIDVKADSAHIIWRTENIFGYELNPSRIIERKNRVYAFSDKGVIASFDRQTGKAIWVHKVANCLVHDLQFFNDNKLVVTTMDGKIIILQVN